MSLEHLKAPDPKQIPYLLELLDDESEEIRREIVRHLTAFGPDLKNELLKLPAAVLLRQEKALEQILMASAREVLAKQWPNWMEESSEIERLEEALTMLAEFQSATKMNYYHFDLGKGCDQLAAEYLTYAKTNDPLELAKFLFEVKGFVGSQNDYFNPQNSNMLYVLQEKRGLPIALSCLYILVGARLSFAIEGYNFPGHFMAKVRLQDKVYLIDGFNSGKVLEENTIVQLTDGAVQPELKPEDTVKTVEMIRRVLNNLINAYQSVGESANQQLMIELYRSIQPD